MFFTSAIAAGMLALILEGFLVERWFKREVDFDLLARLGKGAILPLGLYLALRLSDQGMRGLWPGAIDGSWQSVLFLAEILLGGALPIVLLSIQRIRQTREGLLTSAILGILGIMSQRMSLSMITMYRATGTTYSPSMGETLIAFAIPAAAVLLYLFFAENLQVFERQPQTAALSRPAPAIPRAFMLASMGGPGSKDAESAALSPWPVRASALASQESWVRAVVARRSGFAIFVIALALPILSMNGKMPASPVVSATGWETIHIDGNKSGYVVNFPHLDHQDRLIDESTGESDCQTCHHLDMPEDEATACWECHADYHQPVSIFDHSVHQQALGGNESCLECHTQEHVKLTAEICQECHESMLPGNGQTVFNISAPAYKDAMHSRCLGCHEQQALEQDRPELALCSTCHTYYQEELDQGYASSPGK
jgi:hypothetical protein